MAKYFLLGLVAVLSVQVCVCKPSEQLSALSQNAKKIADDVSKALGIQDLNSEKIAKTITDQSKALADNLQLIVNKLKGEAEAHQPEVENVIKSVETQLTKTADDLKKNLDPKTQKQVEDVRTKLDDGAKSAAAELEKLVKSVQSNKQVQEASTNLQNVAKNALDSLINALKNAESQVKKAVADHEKSHAH